MEYVARWLKNSLFVVGLVLAATVAFALFAVLAIAIRPLMILALVLGVVVAVVLSIFSPSFRDWFEAAGEQQTAYNGLRLATEVALHPSHSWARMDRKGVTVGADDFVQATLGPVESVELPALGSHVEQGKRLFSLRRGHRSVAVRAPVSGTVIERNESLLTHPEKLNESPFTVGWAVRLRGDDNSTEASYLLQGRQAREWFRGEIDRLMTTVLADESLAMTLPDGGALSDELYLHIDDSAWAKLTRTFFEDEEA